MFSDLKFAFRLLVKSPGFTAVALVALALGISAATTMFTFYDAVLLRPMPFLKEENRLVTIKAYNVADPGREFPFTQPDFGDLRARSKTLDGLLLECGRTYILPCGEKTERVLGAWISADGLSTLGVEPILGRSFRAEDEAEGAPPVAILSYAVWQRCYGGTRDILGRAVIMNGESVKIVGVMPEGFRFPDMVQLWQPLRVEKKLANRSIHFWPLYARLRPGATLAQAQAELDTIAADLAKLYPATNKGMGFRATPLRDDATHESRSMLRLMMGSVVFVLLIACGTVANLLLARTATRSREIAIRSALGASRVKIIRLVLTESLLLGIAGGALGVLGSYWLVDFASTYLPAEMPFWFKTQIDGRVLAFAAIATVASSVLFGVLPALQASGEDLIEDLKDGGRCGTESGRTHRLRCALVVAQMALALVLLVGAGLSMRSFWHLQNANPGFDADHVLTFRVGLPPTEYSDEATRGFWTRLIPKLRAIPGVEAAGVISFLPSSESFEIAAFSIEGQPAAATLSEAPETLHRLASPGAIEALHIPLLRGRPILPSDTFGQPAVALVDETFAEEVFPGADPIGKRIRFDDTSSPRGMWYTIVGVVGHVRQEAVPHYSERAIWTALAQSEENFCNAILRVPDAPENYAAAAQQAVFAAEPGIPIYTVKSLSTIIAESLWTNRFFAELLGFFSIVALFLAAIGIYGVMAYAVVQRRQEIGVRMALGAPPRAVIGLVLAQGVRLTAIGLVLGFSAAWFVAHLFADSLHGVRPHDPATFSLVSTVLTVVALAACYLPSRRATRIDPMSALRAD